MCALLVLNILCNYKMIYTPIIAFTIGHTPCARHKGYNIIWITKKFYAKHWKSQLVLTPKSQSSS